MRVFATPQGNCERGNGEERKCEERKCEERKIEDRNMGRNVVREIAGRGR